MNASRDLSHTASVKVLTDILARLEAAEGADRSIDAAIFGLLECTRDNTDADLMRMAEVGEFDAMLAVLDASWVSGAMPVRYTASLDASLALVERVLPGWLRSVDERNITVEGRDWCAAVASPKGESWSRARAKTPALALLCALVKALIARDFAGSDTSRANVTDPGRTKKQPEVKP